jgi:hypothetical protein
LVPDIGWDSIRRNRDSSQQIGPLFVQIDRDLDCLLRNLLLSLVNMDPLEVNSWHLSRYLLSQFDTFVLSGVLSSLHREASQYETLLVIRNLILSEIDLKPQDDIFEGPIVLLSDRLSSSGQVGLRVQ